MKNFNFTLDCPEKDHYSKTVFNFKGNSVEDAALNYLADYHGHKNGPEIYGRIEESSTVQFYGYVYMVDEIKEVNNGS